MCRSDCPGIASTFVLQPASSRMSIPPLLSQQVRYLKIIEKSGYQALPWVRYITQNGGRSGVQQRSAPMHGCTLGNSWAIQRNAVGTDLAPMQFCENGIREGVWQRPAKCGKVNFVQKKKKI